MVTPWYRALLDHCIETKQKLPRTQFNQETSVVYEAADSAYQKLQGYYKVHSQHSILLVILDPCFKLSFFEQQDLNEEPRSEADENKQIRFKSEALGILKKFYAEYAAKTPAYPTPAQKSKMISEPVLYHPLQKCKITSNNQTDEILTYLRMPEPPLDKPILE